MVVLCIQDNDVVRVCNYFALKIIDLSGAWMFV